MPEQGNTPAAQGLAQVGLGQQPVDSESHDGSISALKVRKSILP
jgi:hypothetical protein